MLLCMVLINYLASPMQGSLPGVYEPLFSSISITSDTYKKPYSLRESHSLPETMMWSSKSIPRILPASSMRFVKIRSASEGSVFYQE